MNDQDKSRFRLALVALWVTLNIDKEMPIESQRGYYMALQEYTIDQVERALHLAMKRCKFFPRPTEIIELIDDPESLAPLAWGIVNQQISKASLDDIPSLDFQDRRINQTIRQLGKISLDGQVLNEVELIVRMSLSGRLEAYRKKFFETYKESGIKKRYSSWDALIVDKKEPIRVACHYKNPPKNIQPKVGGQIENLVDEYATT